MKILIVTTGGTICSTASAENGNKNNVNTGAVLPVLVDSAKDSLKDCMEVSNLSFDIVSPINVLSENMTIDAWNVLLAELKKVNYEDYSGLIILHGTDSLHMTAPLLSVLMTGLECPVILVSGNRIITDPESNAVENFANAVRMIRAISDKRKPSGVYVVYRNMDLVSYVHQAALLEECADYSEDFFSRGMIRTEDWLSSDRLAEEQDKETPEDTSLLKIISEIKDDVLYIKPYVGINYDRFSLEGVRCVLHSLYHSSTANAADTSEHSALYMLKRCKAAGIPMYIYPCNKESYRYVTTKALLEDGAIPLDGGTWNLAFAKLLIDGAMQGEEKILG